jgi:hypothetical protein
MPTTTRHSVGGLHKTAQDQKRQGQTDDEDRGTDRERVHGATRFTRPSSTA